MPAKKQSATRYGSDIREEELKNKVAKDFFAEFDCTEIIKNIDFAVKIKEGSLFHDKYLLWAEAKASSTPIDVMLTQLILTIGSARIHHHKLPPPFLGCFDRNKIAFIPFSEIQAILYQNDFNWNVTPSDRETREFKLIGSQINKIVNNEKKYVFDFEKDAKELNLFIKDNFIVEEHETNQIQIDKNNFINIYGKWLDTVKPTIKIDDWEEANKADIIDGDFYLADLLSRDNESFKEKLYVVLKKTAYEMNRHEDKLGFLTWSQVVFNDGQKAHTEFWAKYKRPPNEVYWDYIITRRDLLVPQDVRERKGAFFTPAQWVAKAHEYLQKTFGNNWQDEYYIWDNSAGSGNLLAGLVNKDNIWASTLDQPDVNVMLDRIDNGANLWSKNVFQFDFLNDELIPISNGGKVPDNLYAIISDEEKRQKLIILMNPPYGEAGNAKTRARKGTDKEVHHKAGVQESKIKDRFSDPALGLGKALTEKYIQFFLRIYVDMPGCKMAAFVHPKYICGGSMRNFRAYWKAKYLGGFATPATTHDNCSGKYPICFFVWDLAVKNKFPKKIRCDIFNEKEAFEGVKVFYPLEKNSINDWIVPFNYGNSEKNNIGMGRLVAPDVQRDNYCWFAGKVKLDHHLYVNEKNLRPFFIYFAVRHCVEHKWINDRDQYFFPKEEWDQDVEFQNDCIAYTLFHAQNKIKVREGTNHWIPYTEAEVGCKSQFESRFMSRFIKGLKFSAEAQAVLDAGKKLWRYYHVKAQTDRKANINASYYDIRDYFQSGGSGKMNVKSKDEEYIRLQDVLRLAHKALAKKIEPKVYEYGFLKA